MSIDKNSSEIPGFYKLNPQERIDIIKKYCDLDESEIKQIISMLGLTIDQADKMIENAIGGISIPLGIATNFQINQRDILIPMATEESSVIAACSKAAKIARKLGGFDSSNNSNVMRAQIQILDNTNKEISKNILLKKKELIAEANKQSKTLLSIGGGVVDIITRDVSTSKGEILVVELLVDCKDAMGANICNRMAEAISPMVEEITNRKTLLKIISNYATDRMVFAKATFAKDLLGGDEIVNRILHASAFAESDVYRAVTHNKGIMNGVVAVALAAGQDTRAIEAAAHAYASKDGKYTSLTKWNKDSNGNLVGEIELPLTVGVVGGASSVHPVAKNSLKIMGVKTSKELAEIIASVGLAQNLGALRALVDEGIQEGHMKLHAKNIAISAGAKDHEIDMISSTMIKDNNVSFNRAKELLRKSS